MEYVIDRPGATRTANGPTNEVYDAHFLTTHSFHEGIGTKTRLFLMYIKNLHKFTLSPPPNNCLLISVLTPTHTIAKKKITNIKNTVK